MCRLRTGILFPLTLIATACGHSQLEPTPVAEPQVPLSVLGPGDVFEVRVYGEQDLSGEFRVASDGSINFPLIGRIDVEGKTAHLVSDAISERLTRFVRHPSVSVFVKQYNSKKIYVFGKVQRPGTFAFEDGMNIIQAITLAGGFGPLADQDGTFVTRIVGGREERLEVRVKAIGEGEAPNLRLEPGDIVFVPESMF